MERGAGTCECGDGGNVKGIEQGTRMQLTSRNQTAVAIPTRELGSYTVAPSSSANVMRNNRSVEFDTERRKVAAERMRKITRKGETGIHSCMIPD